MTRITLTTALIGVATTAAAHPGHGSADNSMAVVGFVVLAGLAVIGLPILRRALRK